MVVPGNIYVSNTASVWKTLSQRAGKDVPVFVDCIWGELIGWNVIAPPTSFERGDVTYIQRACINRHNRRVNVGFKDGSARSVKLADLWDLQWAANSTPQRSTYINSFPAGYR